MSGRRAFANRKRASDCPHLRAMVKRIRFIRNHADLYLIDRAIGTHSGNSRWPAGTLCITITSNIAKTGLLSFEV